MHLTCIIPQLLEGISQELGVEAKDLKLVIVADRGQSDTKPLGAIAQAYEGLEWEVKPMNQMRNPETYLEIQLTGDNLLVHPHTRSQASIAHDVKGSKSYADGTVPASLYQVGSYGSRLSALRSKMICAMEGNFTSKGAPRMGEVKHFRPGTHINEQVTEKLAGSPLPLETFLHIHTWHAKYPQDWRAVLIGVQASIGTQSLPKAWCCGSYLASMCKQLISMASMLTTSKR